MPADTLGDFVIMGDECSSEFLNCEVLWFNFLKIQLIKLQFLIYWVFNCLP